MGGHISAKVSEPAHVTRRFAGRTRPYPPPGFQAWLCPKAFSGPNPWRGGAMPVTLMTPKSVPVATFATIATIAVCAALAKQLLAR